MTVSDVLWTVFGAGIVGMTTWGNVEFWRRSRVARSDESSRNDMSAFSPTIGRDGSPPLIERLDGRRTRR